jgi:mRNA interferase RelE/StbE
MRQRVKREIAKLAFNPRPSYAELLRGNLQGRYKIKLDQYRIVYRIDEDVAVVEVLKAGKKHDAFYDDIN